jgi:ABC-type antimicrobial peptide transport system permease subunit
MGKRTELYIMKYGITNISRNMPKSIALISAALVLTISICIISQTIFIQRQSLESVYAQYSINVTIMDEFCFDSTNLRMPLKYYDIVSQNLYDIKDYITDIKVRSNESRGIRYAFDLNGEEQLAGSVIGLTYLPDESEFGYSFSMLPDYSESVLLDSEPVCIVPSTMLEKISGQNKVIYLRSDENNDYISYKIVGTHEGELNDIYCSFESFSENLSRDEYSIYSFGFYLQNAEYNEDVAAILKRYFIEPSIAGVVKNELNELKLPLKYAYVMPKGNLDDVIKPIESDIQKLIIVEPFLFILSVATGFVVSLLSTKNRKAEFAIMRSLGTGKAMVFFEAFFEQFILSLIGILLGIGVFFILYQSDTVLVLWKVSVFFACYMFGTAISVLNIAMINVMKIMKANE